MTMFSYVLLILFLASVFGQDADAMSYECYDENGNEGLLGKVASGIMCCPRSCSFCGAYSLDGKRNRNVQTQPCTDGCCGDSVAPEDSDVRLLCSDTENVGPCLYPYNPSGAQVCKVPVDIVVVIDGSLSVVKAPHEDGYERMQEFTKKLARGMQVSDDAARFALVQFGHNSARVGGYYKCPYPAAGDAWYDKTDTFSPLTGSLADFEAAVDTMEFFDAHCTNIASGVKEAAAVLDTSDRPEANKVIIVVTDGTDDVDPSQIPVEVAAAKAKGYEIFMVGVEGNVDHEVLYNSASELKDGHYYYANKFSKIDQILSSISVVSCPPATTKNTCYGPRDVVLVVDSSGSIKPTPWGQMKQAVSTLLSPAVFNIAPSATNAGIVVFSQANVLHMPITGSQQTATAKAKNMPYYGSGTNLAPALAKARTTLAAYKATRDVSQMVVVLTDGNSANPSGCVAEANALKQAGVKVVTVGIGNVAQSFLKSLVSDPNTDAFYVSTFDQLVASLQALNQIPCGETTERCSPYPVASGGSIADQIAQARADGCPAALEVEAGGSVALPEEAEFGQAAVWVTLSCAQSTEALCTLTGDLTISGAWKLTITGFEMPGRVVATGQGEVALRRVKFTQPAASDVNVVEVDGGARVTCQECSVWRKGAGEALMTGFKVTAGTGSQLPALELAGVTCRGASSCVRLQGSGTDGERILLTVGGLRTYGSLHTMSVINLAGPDGYTVKDLYHEGDANANGIQALSEFQIPSATHPTRAMTAVYVRSSKILRFNVYNLDVTLPSTAPLLSSGAWATDPDDENVMGAGLSCFTTSTQYKPYKVGNRQYYTYPGCLLANFHVDCNGRTYNGLGYDAQGVNELIDGTVTGCKANGIRVDQKTVPAQKTGHRIISMTRVDLSDGNTKALALAYATAPVRQSQIPTVDCGPEGGLNADVVTKATITGSPQCLRDQDLVDIGWAGGALGEFQITPGQPWPVPLIALVAGLSGGCLCLLAIGVVFACVLSSRRRRRASAGRSGPMSTLAYDGGGSRSSRPGSRRRSRASSRASRSRGNSMHVATRA